MKLPFFENLEKGWNQVVNAINQKKWGLLFIYILIVIAFTVSAVLGVIALFRSVKSSESTSVIQSSSITNIPTNFGTSSVQQSVSNNNAPVTMVGQVYGDYVEGDKNVTATIISGDLPRSIEVQKQKILIDSLSQSAGGTVGFVVTMFDPEAKKYAQQLSELFVKAGWKVHPLNITGASGVGDGLNLGLAQSTEEYQEAVYKASQSVIDSFNKIGIKLEINPPERSSFSGQIFENTVYIFVGSKP